mmetsp:Transcript_55128/g.61643  ORF Transcript_55128/g.61643 Transcript_55128/m.61643 type:complete len:332 (-) Transcript_55128:2990-3985(-)
MKENANPRLFSVEKRTQRAPLDWTKLGSFRQERHDRRWQDNDVVSSNTGSIVGSVVVPITAEDKAIMYAIIDCSRSTANGKGVNLLRKAGLVIPTYSIGARNSNKNKNTSTPSTTSMLSSSWCSDSSRPVFSLAKDNSNEDRKTAEEPIGKRQSENEKEKKEDEQINDIMNIGDKNIISAEEIFDIIRNIQDPEHPHSLEQLGVVSLEQVKVSSAQNCKSTQKRKNGHDNDNDNNNITYNQEKITIEFTPTIPHCSMATLIGLCLRVKLFRSLPPATKVDVSIEPGTHVSEKAINKQLRDKERIRAALENKHLAGVVDKCIKNGMNMSTMG